MSADIKAPDQTSISKRAQTIEVNYRPPLRRTGTSCD